MIQALLDPLVLGLFWFANFFFSEYDSEEKDGCTLGSARFPLRKHAYSNI